MMRKSPKIGKEELLQLAAEIEKSVSIESNLQLLERLAKVHYLLSDYEKASDACAKALSIDKDNVACTEIFGLSLLKLKQYQQAVSLLDRIAYTSESPPVVEGYAIALCNVGRMEEALIHVERHLEKDPRNLRYHGLMDRMLDVQSRPSASSFSDEKTKLQAAARQDSHCHGSTPEILHMDNVIPFPQQSEELCLAFENIDHGQAHFSCMETPEVAALQSSESDSSLPTMGFPAEALCKKGDFKMAANRQQLISNVLKTLQMSTPDIEGAAVVSVDGLPISSSLSSEIEEDRVSAMAAAMLSLGERTSDELQRGSLDQVYVKGKNGYVLLNQIGEESVLMVVTRANAKLGMIFLNTRRAASELSKLL